MTLRKHTLFALLLMIGLVVSACVAPAPASDSGAAPADTASAGEADGFAPSSPACIAPAGPGGGWDFTCRAVTKAMSDAGIIAEAVQVSNMEGGGGGVAFAHVVTERNEDNDLIVAASPATTLRIAQGQFGDFTEDDVRWLGAVGADFAALSVAKDSKYQTLDELMDALKADPSSVNFGGGSAVGGQDHMKVMVLAQAAGIDPLALNYTPFDGGGEALTSLLGGFIDVFPGDISEVLGQVEAGEVHVLATLTAERLDAPLADVPTATELGYPAEWVVFRGFYAPGGMSEEAYDWWVDALEKTAASPEWEEARKQAGLGKFALFGADFEEFARNQIVNFRQLSKDLGIIE